MNFAMCQNSLSTLCIAILNYARFYVTVYNITIKYINCMISKNLHSFYSFFYLISTVSFFNLMKFGLGKIFFFLKNKFLRK